MPIRTLTIENLPCELMLHIFEYLSVTDRNSAALTNTCWYETINHLNYLLNDSILIFDENVTISENQTPIITFLKRYKKVRAIRLLKQVQLSDCDSFWQSIGTTLTEIEFVHCEYLTNDGLIRILRQLKRLKVLKLYAPLFRRWKLFQKNRFLINDANIGDVKETLESITHLTLCDSKINDSHFMNLMENLPNLSSFDATSLYFRSNSDDGKLLSTNSILQWLDSDAASNLKDLSLKNVEDVLLEGMSDISQLQFKSLSLQLDHVHVDTLAAFLQNQELLQELRIDLSKCTRPESLVMFLQDIPSLTELKLGIEFTTKSMSAFHKFTNLRKLSTHIVPTSLPSDGSEFNIKTGQNPRLRELEIISGIPYTPGSLKSFSRMISNFKDLTSLTISGVALSDKELQSIFCVMTSLRELHITNCENITDKGITGYYKTFNNKQYSLENLRGLRYLTLSNIHQITDKSLMDGFKLPELQHLELNRALQLSVQGLTSLASNLPALEELTLTTRTFIDKSWIETFKSRFPYLKKISINPSLIDCNDNIGNFCFPFDR